MSVDVKESGPVFDGKAEMAAHEFCNELRDKVADKAREHALVRMGESFKRNTGAYMSSIHVDRGDPSSYVHDLWAFVYGPWLEGDGSRNETTRFKGYHSMRIAAGETEADVPEIADETIRPYLEMMNG